MDTLLKSQIFVDILLIAGLRKELLMAFFVFWESLTHKFCQYLKQLA